MVGGGAHWKKTRRTGGAGERGEGNGRGGHGCTDIGRLGPLLDEAVVGVVDVDRAPHAVDHFLLDAHHLERRQRLAPHLPANTKQKCVWEGVWQAGKEACVTHRDRPKFSLQLIRCTTDRHVPADAVDRLLLAGTKGEARNQVCHRQRRFHHLRLGQRPVVLALDRVVEQHRRLLSDPRHLEEGRCACVRVCECVCGTNNATLARPNPQQPTNQSKSATKHKASTQLGTPPPPPPHRTKHRMTRHKRANLWPRGLVVVVEIIKADFDLHAVRGVGIAVDPDPCYVASVVDANHHRPVRQLHGPLAWIGRGSQVILT